MPTADYTWAGWDTSPTYDNLADQGLLGTITYARDATDVAAKFTSASKNLSAAVEGARSATTTDTWETIFGIPVGSTVTSAQMISCTKKLVANTKLTSHTIGMDLIDSSGNSLMASQLLPAASLATTIDGSYVAGPTGSGVNVNAGSQPSATAVRLRLIYTLTTSGSSGTASVDQRFDDVLIRITYDISVALTGVSATGEVGTLTVVITGIPNNCFRSCWPPDAGILNPSLDATTDYQSRGK